eukprot:2277606-Rhodomonas_salina.3
MLHAAARVSSSPSSTALFVLVVQPQSVVSEHHADGCLSASLLLALLCAMCGCCVGSASAVRCI